MNENAKKWVAALREKGDQRPKHLASAGLLVAENMRTHSREVGGIEKQQLMQWLGVKMDWAMLWCFLHDANTFTEMADVIEKKQESIFE